MSHPYLDTEYSDIMEKSYIDYAMSVIVSRALPDARDGLKPVQRRTLYDMHQLGIRFNAPYRKSARIVGDTMGKFHPHGDSSIYGALVVLAQDFKMGTPLIDGHGNFGSIEGDGAAAMRYTEARLKEITQETMLADLDKDVVDFEPNFDETEKEPVILPAKIPNLLINGSEGIAVGMATNIPPHNLLEVMDAACALIKDPKLSDANLLEYIKGPDFPTGGIVANAEDLPEIYQTGSGKIRIRGKVVIERQKRTGKERIVITEIPYTMIGAGIGKFLNDVAALSDTREGAGISDISNQSSKEGIRIEIELKKGANSTQIEQLLYKKTKLEDTFGVNILAVKDGRPEVLSIKEVLQTYIDFQYELTKRKYTSLLAAEEKKREVQEGLIRAVDVIDLIIEILRGSKNRESAKRCMVDGITDGIKFKTQKSKKAAEKLKFTETQANAILEMRLYKLIGLEITSLQKEYAETLNNIKKYTKILSGQKEMGKEILSVIKKIQAKYGTGRKTKIDNIEPIRLEKVEESTYPAVLIIDRFGYTRSISDTLYEKNKETVDKENKTVIPCLSNSRICIFTNTGKMHTLKMEKVPSSKMKDKGTPLDNICGFDSSKEDIIGIYLLDNIKEKKLYFVTKQGFIKTTEGSCFDATRKTIDSTKLEGGDELIMVAPADPQTSIVFLTKKAFTLRLREADVPEKGKTARGVCGIKLSEGDEVDSVYIPESQNMVTIEVNGKSLSINKLKTGTRASKGTKH